MRLRFDRCPECSSRDIKEVKLPWTPKGFKAMRCNTCNHTWFIAAEE